MQTYKCLIKKDSIPVYIIIQAQSTKNLKEIVNTIYGENSLIQSEQFDFHKL